MKTESLLVTTNWEERQYAEKMGIKIPDPVYNKTKLLFWKGDIKRAMVDEDKIVLEFHDEEMYLVQYDDKTWKELEKYFTKNEEK